MKNVSVQAHHSNTWLSRAELQDNKALDRWEQEKRV